MFLLDACPSGGDRGASSVAGTRVRDPKRRAPAGRRRLHRQHLQLDPRGAEADDLAAHASRRGLQRSGHAGSGHVHPTGSWMRGCVGTMMVETKTAWISGWQKTLSNYLVFGAFVL